MRRRRHIVAASPPHAPTSASAARWSTSTTSSSYPTTQSCGKGGSWPPHLQRREGVASDARTSASLRRPPQKRNDGEHAMRALLRLKPHDRRLLTSAMVPPTPDLLSYAHIKDNKNNRNSQRTIRTRGEQRENAARLPSEYGCRDAVNDESPWPHRSKQHDEGTGPEETARMQHPCAAKTQNSPEMAAKCRNRSPEKLDNRHAPGRQRIRERSGRADGYTR